MIYIENDGALFRGPARGLPQKVWSAFEGRFVPYAFADQVRPIDWGHVIDEERAQTIMNTAYSKCPSPDERPDLYGGYDCQPPKTAVSQEYLDRVTSAHVKKMMAERQATMAEHPPTENERQEGQLDFGTIPDELKKDLVPRTPTRSTGDIEYFEVEGAAFRQRPRRAAGTV